MSLQRIYLGCDRAKMGTSLNDLAFNLEEAAKAARAAGLEIAVAYLESDDVITLASFSSITCSIKQKDAPDAAAMIGPQTIASGSFTALITQQQFADQSAYNALFTFTGSEMNQSPGEYEIWITGIDIVSGDTVPIGRATLSLYEAGLQAAPSGGSYYNSAQSDARYPVKRVAPVALAVANGQTLSEEKVIPGILQADLAGQLLPCDGTTSPRVKRCMVTENPDNSALNTLQLELDAPAAGAITIYGLVLLNQ